MHIRTYGEPQSKNIIKTHKNHRFWAVNGTKTASQTNDKPISKIYIGL